jgi:hypothetical protein
LTLIPICGLIEDERNQTDMVLVAHCHQNLPDSYSFKHFYAPEFKHWHWATLGVHQVHAVINPLHPQCRMFSGAAAERQFLHDSPVVRFNAVSLQELYQERLFSVREPFITDSPQLENKVLLFQAYFINLFSESGVPFHFPQMQQVYSETGQNFWALTLNEDARKSLYHAVTHLGIAHLQPQTGFTEDITRLLFVLR